jgi:hypothetical protein
MPLQYPLVPPRLFRDRGYWSLVLCVTVASMFYYVSLILWPQQVSDLYTKDIIYAGWLTVSIVTYIIFNGSVVTFFR